MKHTTLLIIILLPCTALLAQLNFKHHELQNNATVYSSLVDPIDYDLDGDLDIISYSTAYFRAKILLCYNEDYYFKDCISLEDKIEGQKIKRILYLNNDDKLDYITDDGIMMSNGDDYNFTSSDSPLLSYKLHAEDMNNDGLTDLVPYARDTSSNIIPIIYNQGNSWQIPEIDPTKFTSIYNFMVTDLNSDEKKDLIIKEFGSFSNIYLFHQDELKLNNKLSEEFRRSIPIDINHDGLIDFISTSPVNSNGTRIELHLNSGNTENNFNLQEHEYPNIFPFFVSNILPYPINGQYVANNLVQGNYCSIKWVNDKPELELNQSNYKIEAMNANMIVMGDHIFRYGQTEYAIDLNEFPTISIKQGKTIPSDGIMISHQNEIQFSSGFAYNTYYSIDKIDGQFEIQYNYTPINIVSQHLTNTFTKSSLEKIVQAKHPESGATWLYRITEENEIILIDSIEASGDIFCGNLDEDPEYEILLIGNSNIYKYDNENNSVIKSKIFENVGNAIRIKPLQIDQVKSLLLPSSTGNHRIIDITNGNITKLNDIVSTNPWFATTINQDGDNNYEIVPFDGHNQITSIELEDGDFNLSTLDLDHSFSTITSGDLLNNGIQELILVDFGTWKIYIYEYIENQYTQSHVIDYYNSYIGDVQCLDVDFDGDMDFVVLTNIGIDLYENLLINTSTEEAKNQTSIAIFPNPASGNNITIQNTEHHFHKYKIYNIAGSLIKTGTIQNSNIDIEGISTGLYKLILTGKSGSQTHSIYIQK